MDSNGTRRAGLAIADYTTTMTPGEWPEKLDALRKMPDGPEKTKERERLRQFRPRYRRYVGRSRDDGAHRQCGGTVMLLVALMNEIPGRLFDL